jgi:hypothetical protein
VRLGKNLDRIRLICGNLHNPSQQVTLPVYGGGGRSFVDACRPDQLLTGINLHTGRVVDEIQGVCQKK